MMYLQQAIASLQLILEADGKGTGHELFMYLQQEQNQYSQLNRDRSNISW